MDQVLYAQKTMGGRVVQKYIEPPLLLRRQPRPSTEAVPTEEVPTVSVSTELVPMESAPAKSIPTESIPTQPVPTEPLSSDPDSRWHLYRRRDRLDGSPGPGSRRLVPQLQAEHNHENSKADVLSAVCRTVPNSPHSEMEQEMGPSGGAVAAPLSLPLCGMKERSPGSFGGKEQRGVDVGPPSRGEAKFDLRVWVLVTGWKPLKSF